MKRTAEQIRDEWLVLRSQGGDAASLTELVDRWHQRLLRHVLRQTGGHDEAADVMQEVWVTIVKKLRRLRDPACFPRWAYRITTAACADWVRKQQRDRRLRESIDEEQNPGDQVSADDRQSISEIDLLRRAIGRLPADQRSVLTMFYLDELSTAEIAEALRIPVGTVKSRLYHAREQLRKLVERR
jgi:RNA polymerase sigma-70 factor (ECF subfamily)